jgi:4-diphosphocytidyl-2-C-methyl-D-erythritol kinase
MSALRSADVRALGRALENDLQAPAIALKPSLQRTLDAGIDAGALGALVSGSGPTCVFLVRDSDHGVDVQVALTASGVAAQVVTAYGPVRPSFL